MPNKKGRRYEPHGGGSLKSRGKFIVILCHAASAQWQVDLSSPWQKDYETSLFTHIGLP
jgi:hypothetical protein